VHDDCNDESNFAFEKLPQSLHRKMIGQFFLLLLFLLIPISVFGTVVFVSNSRGNDSASCGSAMSPCASIDFAVGRAADNDTISLAAESFPLWSTVVVKQNGLILTGPASGDRASVVHRAPLSGPMFVANGTVTAFSMFNLQFIGGTNASVLYFNATDDLELLAIENASFVDFRRYALEHEVTDHDHEWFLYAIIALEREPSVNGTHASMATVRMRNLQFRNITTAKLNDTEPSASVGIDIARQEFVKGVCLGLEFGSNLNASIDVELSGIEMHDCRSLDGNWYQGVVAVGFDQQNSSLRFSDLSIQNSTGAVLVDRRTVAQSTLSANSATIEFANCSIRNTVMVAGNPAVQLTVEGTTNIRVADSEISNTAQWVQNEAIGSLVPSTALRIDMGRAKFNVNNTYAQGFVDIDNCVFRTNSLSLLSAKGACVIATGAMALSTTVIVRNSLFEDNHVCDDCLDDLYTGGALQLASSEYAPECAISHFKMLLVEDSTFRRNSAARGGAIGLDMACTNVVLNATFRRSIFDSNVAASARNGAGGAIVFSTPSTGVFAGSSVVTVEDCLFQNNSAMISGGALALTQSEIADNGPFANVVIQRTSMFGNRALKDTQLSLTVVGTILIANSSIGATGTDEQLLTLQTLGGELDVEDSMLLCASGDYMALTNDSRSSSITGQLTRVVVLCSTCAHGTYNLAGEPAIYSTSGIVHFSPFQCHQCPIGARHNCTGDAVGASPSFWSSPPRDANATMLVDFHVCPAHYCCGDVDGCERVDACDNNRTGSLCGACLPEFVHAFSLHDVCVPKDVCSDTVVWVGNTVVVLACAAFVLYLFLRKSATSDGLLKVLVSFCNIAQVVVSNSIELGRVGETSQSAFGSFIRSVFSLLSGMVEVHSSTIAYCPKASMTSLEKLMMPLSVPIVLIGFWALLSLLALVLWRCRRHRAIQRPSLMSGQTQSDDGDADAVVNERLHDRIRETAQYRIFAALLTLLDFSLFIVVGVCVSMLNTVMIRSALDQPPTRRFWKAGDIECEPKFTAAAIVLLLVMLLTPVALIIVQRRKRDSILGVAVVDTFQSAMVPRARLYVFAITVRRASMAFVNAFVTLIDLRVVLIRTILLQAFLLHLFVRQPFASKWVNRADELSMLVLLGVMMLQSSPSDNTGAGVAELGVVRIVQMVILAVGATILLGAFVVKMLPKRLLRSCKIGIQRANDK
jgi:hypothetical protein